MREKLGQFVELDDQLYTLFTRTQKDGKDEEILRNFYQAINNFLRKTCCGVVPPRLSECNETNTIPKLATFVSHLYFTQFTSVYDNQYWTQVRANPPDSDTKTCDWPDCENRKLDKDHIFPQSIGLTVVQFMKKNGADVNSSWLCPRHNRNVKNDSIGIGLWLFYMLDSGE